MNTYLDLDKNIFVKMVLDDSRVIIKEGGIEGFCEEDGDIPDEYQFYIHSVGFSLVNILMWMKQLELTVEFMGNYNYNKASTTSRADHVIYCIENYHIRLNSIYDRVLQLTNRLFHTGMSSEHVSHDRIISNEKVVHRPEIKNLLQHMSKYFKKHAQIRHSLLHRHSLQDKDIRLLELFYISSAYVDGNGGRSIDNIKYIRANYLRRINTKWKSKFRLTNSDVLLQLDNLFTACFSEYIRQKERIRKDII